MSGTKSEFTVRVSLHPHQLDNNYLDHLRDNLLDKFGDKCTPKMGYIRGDSIEILRRSRGEVSSNNFTGDIVYHVTFSCNAVIPKKGDTYNCCIKQINDTCIFCFGFGMPYKFMIPRSDEFSGEEHDELAMESNYISRINELEVGDTVKVEVIDSKLVAGTRTRDPEYWIISRYLEPSTFPKSVGLTIDDLGEEVTYELKWVDHSSERKTHTPKSKDILDTPTPEYVLHVHPDWVTRGDYMPPLEDEGNSKFQRLAKLRDAIPVYKGKKTWKNARDAADTYGQVRSESAINNHVVSRAFFKLLEILQDKHVLVGDMETDLGLLDGDDMSFLCIGESPGAFIQSILYARNYAAGKDKNDSYFIASIDERDDPRGENKLWKRLQDKLADPAARRALRLTETPNMTNLPDDLADFEDDLPETEPDKPNMVFVHEKDANLLDTDNINAIAELVEDHDKANLITADGGIDMMDMDRYQEMIHYKLAAAECLLALKSQADGGSFILKMYDMLTDATVQLIAMMGQFYSNTIIYKPYTSRQLNSEKYVIFHEFKSDVDTDRVETALSEYLDAIGEAGDEKTLQSFGEFKVDGELKSLIVDYNSVYVDVSISKMEEAIRYAEGGIPDGSREARKRSAKKFLADMELDTK